VLLLHNSHEASQFVNGLVAPNTTFLQYLDSLYPENEHKCLRKQITGRYKEGSPKHPPRKLKTDLERMTAYLEDTWFGLSTYRGLIELFAPGGLINMEVEGLVTKVYGAVFDIGEGNHGTDLLLTFYQPNTNFGAVAEKIDPSIPALAKKWQSYLISHARTGNVNTYKAPSAPEWQPVSIDLEKDREKLYETAFFSNGTISFKEDPQIRLQMLVDVVFVTLQLVQIAPIQNVALCVEQKLGLYEMDAKLIEDFLNSLPPEIIPPADSPPGEEPSPTEDAVRWLKRFATRLSKTGTMV